MSVLPAPQTAARAAVLSAKVARSGLASLAYGGANLLGDGALSMQAVDLIAANGSRSAGSTTPSATKLDSTGHLITQTYPWGTLRCRYAPAGKRLGMTIAVTDSSSSTIQDFGVQLMQFHFPRAPKEWVPNYVYVGTNFGTPSIVMADLGSSEMAVCDEDADNKPVILGFPGRATLIDRPLVLSTQKGLSVQQFDQYMDRPIHPGATDVFHLSIRFAPSGTPEASIARDILVKLAKNFPSTLNWPDRRAIGALHLATADDPHHSRTNPAGWFMDPTGVDVRTPSGRAAFKARMMKYADDSIKILKDENAQGMIVWDIEGEAHENVYYYGDPRQIGKLAPEMDAIADPFFKKFRDAGLRVGVCIRPQLLTGAGTNNLNQVELTDNSKIVALLLDKIRYCNKRWGCTLFYVDSDGDPNAPYSYDVFRQITQQLRAERIKALIMPEQKTLTYYAYTMPYGELRLGMTGAPAVVRAAYPKAGVALYVPDGPVDADRNALIKSVKSGDILMFRGWWPDSFNAQVKALYAAAGK